MPTGHKIVIAEELLIQTDDSYLGSEALRPALLRFLIRFKMIISIPLGDRFITRRFQRSARQHFTSMAIGTPFPLHLPANAGSKSRENGRRFLFFQAVSQLGQYERRGDAIVFPPLCNCDKKA